MNVLHVISSLNPAYGGPAAALRSLTPAWTELGHASEIVCVDTPDAPFLAEYPGPVHALGPSRLGYEFSPRLVPWLRREAHRFDALLVHGLWQYHGLAVHRAAAQPGFPPYFVFTHGMLDPWFRHEYPLKHLKKIPYWWLAERRVLRDAAAVLFTCEEERLLARQSFRGYRCHERVVAFGTAGPEGDPGRQREAFYAQCPTVPRTPFWLFFGRIHPKKGMDLLIDAYGELAARSTLPLPALVIAGPCADEAYLNQLKARAGARCPAGSVHWTGMLSGDVKWGVLHAAEVFVLPSHQENFGIAVAEALACGTPVLISNKVNIWREIQADNAGIVATDDLAGTSRLFAQWTALSTVERDNMRAAATACFQSRYSIGSMARHLAQVLAHPPASTPATP